MSRKNQRIGIASALLLLAGCTGLRPETAGRDLARQAVPEAYAGKIAEATIGLPSRWWEQFGSAELNGLIQTAFGGNLDMAQAWARLRQVRAQAVIAGASRRVSANAEAGAQTSRARQDRQMDSSNDFSLGVSISYELDVWGRLRAGTTAALLESQASRQDAEATALVLSGLVAETWIGILAQQEQVALLKDQIQTTRSVLDLLLERQRKGLSAAVDVYQQKQIVAESESLLPLAEQNLQLLRQALAVLLGQIPEQPPELITGGMPMIGALPDAGIPGALLEQRPDIRAAWSRLQASEWDVVAAKADRLPTLRLTGSAATDAGKLEDIFDDWAANLLAGLAAPLVDGGRRRAEVESRRAVVEQQALAYRQTVLTALQEVENALTRENHQQRYLAKVREQLDYAATTLEEAQRRYQKGVTDYLPVLSALNAKLRLERSLVEIRQDLLTNRVALCRALGGGWTKELKE